MTAIPQLESRRPAGRLFLLTLAALLLASAALAGGPPINIQPPSNFQMPWMNQDGSVNSHQVHDNQLPQFQGGSSYSDCVQNQDPTACQQGGSSGQNSGSNSQQNRGVLDLVENDYKQSDITFPGSWAVPDSLTIPVIHIMDEQAYKDCIGQGPLADCNKTWYILRPAAPKGQKDKAQKGIDKAWTTFRDNMAHYIDSQLANCTDCVINPPLCSAILVGVPPTPIPNVAAILATVAPAYVQGLAKYYPIYWEDVLKAIAENLPNSVAFGLSLNPLNPIQGSIDAPIFSLTPNTNNIVSPSNTAQASYRDLYYYKAYLDAAGVNPPIIAPPGSDNPNTVGIDQWDQAKSQQFGIDTGKQYEYLGYAAFYQVTAPKKTVWFSKFQFGLKWYIPSVQVHCVEFDIPIPGLIFPVPIPGFLPIAKGDVVSVGEGYRIPHSNAALQAFPESITH